jgi:hypothetical protein
MTTPAASAFCSIRYDMMGFHRTPPAAPRRGLCAGLFLFALCLAAACRPAADELPVGILPPDRMTDVLVDFHLARARWQAEALVDTRDSGKIAYYKEVLDKHGITWSVFKASMDYYTQRPGQLTEIYNTVIERLSKKQAEAAAGQGE